MLRTIYGQVSFGALVVVVLAAFLFGGRTERMGAGVLAVGSILGMEAQAASHVYDPAWVLFAIDLMVFAGFVALTWRSPKRWPFMAVAFLGVGLGVHAIRLVTQGMHPWIYLTAVAATDYGVMGSLAVGVWRRRRWVRDGSFIS